MCVWSAYVGRRQAAPEVWKALRDIEGLWAGFYTGVATVDRNGIHQMKCAGSTDVWQRKFNLAELPGTVAIAHSRTNSGGDDGRAHPYMAYGGRVTMISQGCTGFFKSDADKFTEEYGNWLLDRGCKFVTDAPTSNSPVLKDGTKIAMSEIVSNMIGVYYDELKDPIAAIRKGSGLIPEESANVLIFADYPDRIYFNNYNQHMVYLKDSDGFHLSVTEIGLPGYGNEIPGNVVGYVTADAIYMETFLPELHLDTALPKGTVTAMVDFLRDNPGITLGRILDNAINPLFSRTAAQYRCVATWRAIETLWREKRVRFEARHEIGCCGQESRPFGIYLQE